MAEPFDREGIARIFDEYGDAEWARHDASPMDRVSFHVHRHYLERFVRPGDRVLEVGAGAGRFTVELARLGARVTVVDISPEQLRLNEEHLAEAGLEEGVEARYLADVLDMSRFGTLHAFLAAAAEEIEAYGVEEMQDIVESGYLSDNHSTLGPMHLYTWAELRALLEHHQCDIIAASAANFLSIGNDGTCERWIRDDPAMWKRFLAWEVASCSEPGAIDGGTHIVAVVRPPVVGARS